MAIETLYFSKNVTTAMQVAEVRGVIRLAAAERDLPVAEYTPNQIKQAVTGSGRAEKRQVQEMVRRVLALDESPARTTRPTRSPARSATCRTISATWDGTRLIRPLPGRVPASRSAGDGTGLGDAPRALRCIRRPPTRVSLPDSSETGAAVRRSGQFQFETLFGVAEGFGLPCGRESRRRSKIEPSIKNH